MTYYLTSATSIGRVVCSSLIHNEGLRHATIALSVVAAIQVDRARYPSKHHQATHLTTLCASLGAAYVGYRHLSRLARTLPRCLDTSQNALPLTGLWGSPLMYQSVHLSLEANLLSGLAYIAYQSHRRNKHFAYHLHHSLWKACKSLFIVLPRGEEDGTFDKGLSEVVGLSRNKKEESANALLLKLSPYMTKSDFDVVYPPPPSDVEEDFNDCPAFTKVAFRMKAENLENWCFALGLKKNESGLIVGRFKEIGLHTEQDLIDHQIITDLNDIPSAETLCANIVKYLKSRPSSATQAPPIAQVPPIEGIIRSWHGIMGMVMLQSMSYSQFRCFSVWTSIGCVLGVAGIFFRKRREPSFINEYEKALSGLTRQPFVPLAVGLESMLHYYIPELNEVLSAAVVSSRIRATLFDIGCRLAGQ